MAASKLYTAPETERTWSDAATTSDELLDAGGLAADGVVCGSYHDKGTGSQSEKHQIVFRISGFDTAPVVGETVDLYLTLSDATTGFSGAPTTDPTDVGQGTLTVNQLKNLQYVGSLTIVSTTAADDLKAVFGNIKIPTRYYAPVVHNNSSDALLSSSDAHLITVRPNPLESQ